MLPNLKLNDTDQNILWEDLFHTRQGIINSMATRNSTKSPFGIFYGEKPKIICSFSELGRIAYVTKQDKFKKQMTDKTFKTIMVGCSDNNTIYTYKLYKIETNRVIMTKGH